MEVRRRSSGGLTALYNPQAYYPSVTIRLISSFYTGREIFIRRAVGDDRPLTLRDVRLITESFLPEARATVIVNYNCHPPRRFLCAWAQEHLFANRPRNAN